MASKQTLMAVGMPAAQAFLLGSDAPASFTLAGTTQATATPITSNFATLVSGGAGNTGVVLPPASGQGMQVITGAGVAANLYPAPGDRINVLAVNAALTVPPNTRLLLIPGNGGWVAIVSA